MAAHAQFNASASREAIVRPSSPVNCGSGRKERPLTAVAAAVSSSPHQPISSLSRSFARSANLPIGNRASTEAATAAGAAPGSWAPRSVGAWLHHYRGRPSSSSRVARRSSRSRSNNGGTRADEDAANDPFSSPDIETEAAANTPNFSADDAGGGGGTTTDASSSGAETASSDVCEDDERVVRRRATRRRTQTLLFGSDLFVPPHVLVERQASGPGGFLFSSSAFAAAGGGAFGRGGATDDFARLPVGDVALGAVASSSPPVSGSVRFGAGRKLTGAAAARFRQDVLRQTGFLENGGGSGGSAVASAAAAIATATTSSTATATATPTATPAAATAAPLATTSSAAIASSSNAASVTRRPSGLLSAQSFA